MREGWPDWPGEAFSRPDGRGRFSHDDGWFIAPPMSSEETPPLHFRLKPKIPLKLRSFLLSPPDPLRWAPAGAPPFLSAEKEKTLQRALSPLRGSPWRAVHGPLHSPWRLCRLGLRRPPCGEKRKGRFWSSHKCTPFLDQTGGSLTRGRRDVLLFPRFAPSLYRVGGITDHFLSVERCRGDDPSPVPSQFRTSVQTPYRGHRPPQICHFMTGIWEQIHRQK